MSEKKKYIVEATELQDGQEISSGGIRKNGKMVEMFSNPVPYTEPKQAFSQTDKRTTNDCTKTVQSKRDTYTDSPQRQKTTREEMLKSMVIDCLFDVASILWDDFKPILRAKVNTFLSEKHNTSVPLKVKTTIKLEEPMKEQKFNNVSKEQNTAVNVIPISRYRAS